jgi:chromosome segregation ATPase
MTTYAVSGLRQKFTELQEERATLQARIKEIDTSIATLSDAIKLIDPEIELSKSTTATARATLKQMFVRKEVLTSVQKQLRQATEPLSASAISERILAAKTDQASNEVKIMLRRDVSALLAHL